MDIFWRVFESTELQRGLIAGLIAGAIAALVGRLIPKLKLGWGFVWFAAVLLAGASLDLFDRSLAVRAFSQHGSLRPLAAIALACGVYGLYANRGRPETVLALLLSLGGVWATVPDTEQVLLLLGVTIPLLWLVWPRSYAEIGIAGALWIMAAGLWAVGVGSLGREGANVGGFGALASVALLAVPCKLPSPARLGFHTVLVFGWSRMAGLSRSATTALVIGAAITIVVQVVKLLLTAHLNRATDRG